MLINVTASACFLIVLLILVIDFYSKEKVANLDITSFKHLSITCMIGLFAEFMDYLLFIIGFDIHSPLMFFIGRFIYIYYFVFMYYFILYVYGTCKRMQLKNERYDELKKLLTVIYSICAFFVIILPFDFGESDKYLYPVGLATDFSYLIGVIAVVFIFIMCVKNIKNLKQQKAMPILWGMIGAVLSLAVQYNFHELLLLIPAHAISIIVMYFTIENPDIKMVKELYKNKKIIDKSNQSISNLLFKISQDIKYPINRIVVLSESSNIDEVKEIHNLGKNLQYLVDDILDVSSMTTKDLKIYNTTYNPKNIFDSLKYKTERDKHNNVRLEYSLSDDLPDYVYGDSLKVKQILSSVLKNSTDHTEDGFISFEVNTIIKYGVCRFIIDIEDSSSGISIDKVNDILSLDEKEEHFDFDNPQLKLKEVKAMVSKIGGSFMIKSEEGMGTTVSITLDQKIVELNKEELVKRMELYEASIKKNKKIMVIDDDVDELAFITNYLEEKNVDVDGSLFGKDLLEKLRNKNKYDLIILDDETDTGSAISMLEELKKKENFKTPVVVMIDKQKEFIKLQYLKDGFADVILKSKLKDELDRMLKRF